jgi:adenylosuccinate synthase
MPVAVIVGAQWGDEGKGKVVDLYTSAAHVVVRWAGGANAGHTLVVDGQKYVTRLIPSGVLHKNVTCVLGEGMVIDPETLVEEVTTFRKHGFLASDENLVIAERAHITLPLHRELDRLREEGPNKIGTTKRGIGPTYESKMARLGLRVGDLLRPARLRARLAQMVEVLGPILTGSDPRSRDIDAVTERYLALGATLRPFVRDASRWIHDQIAAGRNVMLEGGQGVLLDIDHGTYPYVTSSNTTAGGACAALGLGPSVIDQVVGIAKTYVTRVGLGPFPTELDNALGLHLRTKGAEFGAVTGRPRRCGWLDIPALRLAVRLSGIQGLALTKLDVLSGLPSVKMCVAYHLHGRTLDEMPLDLDDLAEVEPVFEEFPGWPEFSLEASAGAVSGEAALPEAARAYLARLVELVGVPAWLTSVGPGRHETLVARHPFTS